MAKVKLFSILFLLLLAKPGISQQMTQQQFVTRMMAEIARVFDATNIEIKSSNVRSTDQTSLLTGKCNFFNVTEIDFAATFDEGERIRSFSITVPLGQKFDGSKIQAIAKSGDYINLFLPKDVRNGLVLNKYTINFSETLSVTNVSVDMGLNTSIPFKVFGLPNVKVKDLKVGYRIDNPLTAPAVSGKMGASLYWGEMIFPFETILSRDPKKFAISVGIRDLTLNSVITNFAIPNDLLIPENINRVLKIDSAKLTIYPGAYTFVFEGGSPLGAVNFVVKRVTVENKPVQQDTLSTNTSLTGNYSADPENPDPPPPKDPKEPIIATAPATSNRWGILAGFQLPESSDEVPAVNIMRKAGLTNIGLVISTIMDDGVETTLPIFANVGSGNTLIQRGFTFISWISVHDLLTKYYLTKPLRAFAPQFMKDLSGSMPIESVMFRANVPLTVTDISLEGDINFNEQMQLIPTTDLIVLRQLKLIVKPMATSPEFSFGATWEMKIDPTRTTPLKFNSNMFVKTDGSSVTLGVDGAMLSSWENPYGYKGLSINSPKLKVGLSFSDAIIPIPDDLFFSGQMMYGALMGDITLGVNYNELTKNMLVARVCNLSIKNVLDQWLGGLVSTELNAKKNIYKQFLDEALNVQLKDAYLKVVPPMAPAELMSGLRLENDYTKNCPPILKLENTFLPGVRIAAAGEFAGWKGLFDIGAEGSLSSLSGGVTVKGSMDPIKIGTNGFKVFHLTGFNENDPFQLYFDLSTNSLLNGVKGLLSDPNASKSATGFVNTDAPFYIKAVHSNKVLDITGAGMNYGIMAIQAQQNSAASQQFIFEPFEEGYYTIKNVNSKMNLDIQNGVANNGQPVWQYMPNTTPAQLFKLVPAANGNFYFESKLNPSMVLEIGANSMADGAQLKLANKSAATNQQFQLLAAEQGSGTPFTMSDRIFYLSGAITIMDIAQAKALVDLTPAGYKFQARGKIYKALDCSVDATIGSFRNILGSSDVKGLVNIGLIQQKIMDAVSKKIGDIPFFDELKKGFVLKTISFGGSLEGLQSNVNFKVVFKVAGQSFSPSISLTPGEIANGVDAFVEKIAGLIKSSAGPVIEFAKKTFNDAIAFTKQTAEQAVKLAVQTTQSAIDLAKKGGEEMIQLKNKLVAAAPGVYTTTRDGIVNVGQKTAQWIVNFAGFSARTIEGLYGKTIDQIKDGWGGFTVAVKNAFTGGDNQERITYDGPAFRILTKYQGFYLSATPNIKKNFPVAVKPLVNSYLETWQIVPNDTEGSFFLVSGYNALLVTKPEPTHLTLIPHESEHKGRERMKMETVPNEPGWYYLRYLDVDGAYLTYAEVKTVAIDNISQLVLAPVRYAGGNKPGNYGKFRFEKAGDIDWTNSKIFPPVMVPAAPLVQSQRYQFAGQPEQYIYDGMSFRWIPDYESLLVMKFDSRPLKVLPNNQQVSTVIGTPFPSAKDGALIKSQNADAVYIMENGKARHIPDIETFNAMALLPSMIQVVPQPDFLLIPVGEIIPSRFIAKSVLQERVLYRVAGNPLMYIIINRTARVIPDMETLGFMGYNNSQFQNISMDELKTVTVGTNLPTRKNGSMFKTVSDPTVYYMENGIRRAIPDTETLNGMKLEWGKIQIISIEDMNDIPKGPGLISMK